MNLYTIAIFIYNLWKQRKIIDSVKEGKIVTSVPVIKPRVQAVTAAYVMLLSTWQGSFIPVNKVFMIRN